MGKVNDEGINNEYHQMENEKRMTQGKIRTGVVDIITNVFLFLIDVSLAEIHQDS